MAPILNNTMVNQDRGKKETFNKDPMSMAKDPTKSSGTVPQGVNEQAMGQSFKGQESGKKISTESKKDVTGGSEGFAEGFTEEQKSQYKDMMGKKETGMKEAAGEKEGVGREKSTSGEQGKNVSDKEWKTEQAGNVKKEGKEQGKSGFQRDVKPEEAIKEAP